MMTAVIAVSYRLTGSGHRLWLDRLRHSILRSVEHDSIHIRYRLVIVHHVVASFRATPLDAHNRCEYGSRFIDFDAEFSLSLKSPQRDSERVL
jgi:hypothetical protein